MRSYIKNFINRQLIKYLHKCEDIFITVKQPDHRTIILENFFQTNFKKNVLISYILWPFLKVGDEQSHSNFRECYVIAKAFYELNYNVDIIHWDNESFIPKKKYHVVLDIHSNLERLNAFLDKDCVKILHIVNAHWLYQNYAEYKRLHDIKKRKGVALPPQRILSIGNSINFCDFATILGNSFTAGTYNFIEKELYHLPISTTVSFEWNDNKDFDKCKRRFLWFGSHGFALKGLDLVLEAFSEMPEFELIVCGLFEEEKDFISVYNKELYSLSNVKSLGWINVQSEQFYYILQSCLGVIYPSASEGGGGSVITCMQGGLIPIVSYEASVDIRDFGYQLEDNTIDEIKTLLNSISEIPAATLREKAYKAWYHARKRFTIENFETEFKRVIQSKVKK